LWCSVPLLLITTCLLHSLTIEISEGRLLGRFELGPIRKSAPVAGIIAGVAALILYGTKVMKRTEAAKKRQGARADKPSDKFTASSPGNASGKVASAIGISRIFRGC
jgi:hypothetical protein